MWDVCGSGWNFFPGEIDILFPRFSPRPHFPTASHRGAGDSRDSIPACDRIFVFQQKYFFPATLAFASQRGHDFLPVF
jgi:hypothetical protein